MIRDKTSALLNFMTNPNCRDATAMSYEEAKAIIRRSDDPNAQESWTHDDDVELLQACLRYRAGPQVRVPTLDEIQELQQRFGITGVTSMSLRGSIVEAASLFHGVIHLPTARQRIKLLEAAKNNALAFLQSLGVAPDDEGNLDTDKAVVLMPAVQNMSVGRFREMWQTVGEVATNLDRDIEAWRPVAETQKKDRRKSGKGLNLMIVHLALILVEHREQSPVVYIHYHDRENEDNNKDSRYSGELIEFVEAVCRLCRIESKNQTIGDAIKELKRLDAFPWSPRRVKRR